MGDPHIICRMEKGMKHPVIALRLHSGEVEFGGTRVKMKLPDGCIGICFAFESKKKAKEYWGKDSPFVRMEKEKEVKNG